MKDWFATEGSPSPLGVTWVPAEEAFNFALHSKHATAVTLLLYAPDIRAAALRLTRLRTSRGACGLQDHSP